MSGSSPITPQAHPWYHGSITRLQTEECLMRAYKTGSFLVRDSESFKGAYVLSVLCEGRIYQYRILPDENGYLIKSSDASKQHTFSNIPELIQSYSIVNNGLCCALKYPTEGQKAETEEEQLDTDDEDEEPDPLLMASTADIALHVLRSRAEHLNLGPESQFMDQLRDYLGSKVKQDYEDIKAGATMANNLRQLVLNAAKDLTKQLDLFLTKMEALQRLFDVSSIPSKTNPSEKAGRTNSDLKHLFSRLGECQARVTSLENKAVATFLELGKASIRIPVPHCKDEEDAPSDTVDTITMDTTSNGLDTLKAASQPMTLNLSKTPFEVKVEGLTVDALKNTKVKLTVDVPLGSFSIMKHFGKEMKEELTSYTHDQIIQLIKSRVNNTKLQIRLSNGKKKDYSFEDAKKRETFCQLIQYMKMMHTNSKELDQISIFIGTWNMGAAMPPSSITSWLTCQGDGKTRDLSLAGMQHDIYVIGTQEFKSAAISDKEWISRVRTEICRLNIVNEKEYVVVAMVSLWGLRLAVFVSPDHEHQISHVRDSFVRTGIANTLGNKGAVGVSFHFAGTSLCFINAHLTSGTEKCTRRNNNYHDIIRGLALSSKGLSGIDLTNQFHHVFFLGDLNYRIEWTVPEIMKHIKEKNYTVLFEHEQLKREKDKNKIFVDFDEEELTFPPTYRFKVGTRVGYDYKKVKTTMVRINEPSWCDRVIWRSYPGTHNVNTSYGCTTDITTSDHSPVFATFDVGIAATTVIPKGSNTQDARIVFASAEATIKTNMCGIFYLEFYSSCLEAGTAKSGMNKTGLQDQVASKVSQIRLSWSSKELPKLTPILSDFDYLEEQHILVAIKASDSEESYGECVVSLKDKISSTPVPFQAVLTHQGHWTGEIRGSVHVKAKDESLYGGFRRTKTYEFVSFEEKEREKVDRPLSPDAHGKSRPKKFLPAKAAAQDKSSDFSDALLNPVSRRRPNGDLVTSFRIPTDLTLTIGQDEDGVPPPLPPPRRGASPVTPDTIPLSEPFFTRLQPPKQLSIDSLLTTDLSKPQLRSCLSSPGDRDMEKTREAALLRAKSPQMTMPADRPLPVLPPEITSRTDPSQASPPIAVPVPMSGTARKPTRKHSPGKVLQLRAQFEKGTGNSISLDDANKPPLPMRYTEMNPLEDEILIEVLPPPLPAKAKTPPKNQLGFEQEYEVLRPPATIAEWLMNLGLPQYGYQLLSNGWDSVVYLDTLTNKDLQDCQIDDAEHRWRMLDSIKNMAKMKR